MGSTAVVGNDCTFLHGVTLGSTGKESGDRHPKIGNKVLIGCGATILGNIFVGDGAKIGSNSTILKPVPEKATAVGTPARVIGGATGNFFQGKPQNRLEALEQQFAQQAIMKKMQS